MIFNNIVFIFPRITLPNKLYDKITITRKAFVYLFSGILFVSIPDTLLDTL